MRCTFSGSQAALIRATLSFPAAANLRTRDLQCVPVGSRSAAEMLAKDSLHRTSRGADPL